MPGVGVCGLFVMEKSTLIRRPSNSMPLACSLAWKHFRWTWWKITLAYRTVIKIYESKSCPSKTQSTETNLFGILPVLKVDKGEATWAARLLVVDYGDAGKRAVFREHFSQVSLGGVQAQAKHTQATVGFRVCLRDEDKEALQCYGHTNSI